ncbi:MAG: cell division protein FtsQ [Betaproteobacteria bacterium]|nr:cell division protein FtsQ [Betaproteobacteria bacterium]
MSQLKKQDVVGRKPVRRKAPTSSSAAKPKSASLWGTGLRACRTAFHWISVPFQMSLKRWPKATLIVTLGASATAALGYGIFLAMDSLTSALPERLEINSPRPDLHAAISTLASDTLQTARREQWTRSALTDKLLSRISMVDGVDEVSVRAGIDRKMRINVVAQAPLLVLEGKGNERILIGSKFKIIARGLGATDYAHLPQLEAPELNLNIRASREKKKTQTGLFLKPNSFSSANVRWLSQQSIRINSLFESEKIPVDVEKILYRNGSGFSALVKHRETLGQVVAEPVQTNPRAATAPTAVSTTPNVHKFTIILGENQFQEKFSRLQQIIQDLRLKRSPVDQIDLAFSDKAIIRMSEQLTDVKRGGLQ